MQAGVLTPIGCFVVCTKNWSYYSLVTFLDTMVISLWCYTRIGVWSQSLEMILCNSSTLSSIFFAHANRFLCCILLTRGLFPVFLRINPFFCQSLSYRKSSRVLTTWSTSFCCKFSVAFSSFLRLNWQVFIFFRSHSLSCWFRALWSSFTILRWAAYQGVSLAVV